MHKFGNEIGKIPHSGAFGDSLEYKHSTYAFIHEICISKWGRYEILSDSVGRDIFVLEVKNGNMSK